MTDVLDRELDLVEPGSETAEQPAGVGAQTTGEPDAPAGATPRAVTAAEALRPLLVAALATSGAALMTGGIFGSWTARLLATTAALLGVGWSLVAFRAKNRIAFQVGLIPAAFVLGTVALVPTEEGPTGVLNLMNDAITAGRLLRPPVPFDGGWRPILFVIFMVLGFGAGWIALALKRPQLALLLPVPVLLLTAISQPAEAELLGSVIGFMPVLLALGVLFGGDMERTERLDSAFEIKRLVRAVPMAAAGLALLILISQGSFLFPDPVYDPTEKPQKPKSIPLGEVEDRVLFEIKDVEGQVTGPWRVGVLDVYDGSSWRLPPFAKDRFRKVPGDGVVEPTRVADRAVQFTVRDVGDSSVLPGVTDPVAIDGVGRGVVFDPRPGTFRMANGRVPDGLTYTQRVPSYPTPEQLKAFGPALGADPQFLEAPKPPVNIQAVLDQAPENPWERLEVLRKKLNEDVVAAGAGNPSQPVPPKRVDDLMFGSKEGSPYEIVAAEALLARWAGWPARIGFGFDGFNAEDDLKTVRPKNGSNWLEIKTEGAGWVPIIGAPPKAKSTLDTDPNARFDENIIPSDDVAVELLIPVKLESLRLLYERVRALLLSLLPFALALVALYLSMPAIRREMRRRKRRAWARAQGPRAEIVVEYAELRDALLDLNVGDVHDTPLEYLQRCVDDDEHTELAWLVTRATYGDLAFAATEEHADAAAELAHSVRRRMSAAQPLQSRVLAWLSRESLRRPYTAEIPTVKLLKLKPRLPQRTNRGNHGGKRAIGTRLAGAARKAGKLIPVGGR